MYVSPFRPIVQTPVNAVADTLRSQNGRAIERMDAGAMPRHVQRAIDKALTTLLNSNPGARYDDDHYARVFTSESDERTAGYALFVHETDAKGKEATIVIGFDLSGARVFRDRISI